MKIGIDVSHREMNKDGSAFRGLALETEKNLEKRITELNTWSNEATKHGSWSFVLGGDSPLHMDPDGRKFNDYLFAREDGNLYRAKAMQLKLWLGRKWNTGVDLDQLAESQPDKRWKYYLSLNLSDPTLEQGANSFFRNLLQNCTKEKVSLMTKTQDHNYDSLLIYTFHPEQMDEVIRQAYKNHPTIWSSVKRVFQKPINEVNSNHIARVQEPFGGHNGSSHSGRMWIIGDYFDKNKPGIRTIDRDIYVNACRTAMVKSEKPWEIA